MARRKPVFPMVRPQFFKNSKKRHQEKRRIKRRERRKKFRAIKMRNKAVETECCVCLEAKDEWTFWPCLHKVCTDCAEIILANNRLCPECKVSFPGSSGYSSGSGDDSSDVSSDSEDGYERRPPRLLDGRNMVSVSRRPEVIDLVD